MKGCRSLNKNEIKAIMELKGIAARDRAMFILQLNTGCRIGEILSLRIKDVANKNGFIFSSFELKAKNVKTRRGASIVINNTAKSALSRHVRILLSKGYSMDSALFPSRQGRFGTGITRARAAQIYKNLFEMAQVYGGRLATHCCRKSFSAAVYSQSKDILLVKTLLRHANISSSLSYLESALQSVKDAVLTLKFV